MTSSWSLGFHWIFPGSSKPKPKDPDIRIVLIGKAGAGKSTAGNTILGKKTFGVGATTSCLMSSREWGGRRIGVIDTPASVYEEGPASSEMRCLLYLSRPGPHVLVLVASLKHGFDGRASELLRNGFGDEATKNTVVLFTNKEALGSKTLGEYVQESEGQRAVMEQFNGKYCAFDLEAGDPQGRQVNELLSKIQEIVQKNRNKPFLDSEKAKHPKQTQEERGRLKVEEDEANAAFPADPGSPSLAEEPELRIILVGKTGTGKSATGNTILGEERFESKFEFTPVTQKCMRVEREWKGKRIAVIDTPAIFKPGVAGNSSEINNCLRLCRSAPHALVLVTQTGRFTEEDHRSAEGVEKVFGKEAWEHMVVLFTRREDLGGGSLKEFVEGTDNEYLRRVILACGNRYCGFDNRETGEGREKQAEELLSLIEEMVRKKGGRPCCSVKQGEGSQPKSKKTKSSQMMEGTSM